MNLNWLLYISLYFLEYSHTIYLFENQTLNLVYVTPLSLLRWQAIVLATLSILGSLLASFLVFHLFFKKGGNE